MAKVVKQKNNKGFLSLFIFGLFFLVGGAIFLFMVQTETAQSLKNKGAEFDATKNVGNAKTVAVGVEAVEKVEADSVDYLLVLTDKNQIVLMEFGKNDAYMKELVNKADENGFLPNTEYIATKQVELNADSKRRVRSYLSDLSSNYVTETDYVLSMGDYNNDKLFGTLGSIAAIVGGLALMVFGVFKRVKNKNQYALLYATYPELEQNIDLLQTDSSFYNKTIGTSVYKEHLVTMKGGFEIFHLPATQWIGYTVTTTRHNGVTTRAAALNVLAQGETKPKKITLGRYNDKIDVSIQDLFRTIAARFPHIALGESDKPNTKGGSGAPVGNQKMSLDELMAQEAAQEQQAKYKQAQEAEQARLMAEHQAALNQAMAAEQVNTHEESNAVVEETPSENDNA